MTPKTMKTTFPYKLGSELHIKKRLPAILQKIKN